MTSSIAEVTRWVMAKMTMWAMCHMRSMPAHSATEAKSFSRYGLRIVIERAIVILFLDTYRAATCAESGDNTAAHLESNRMIGDTLTHTIMKK